MFARKALISYSHKDETYRSALEVALSAAVRAGELTLWSDHRILPGQDFDEEILSQLQTADLVLLLISPDFIASDYCYKKELQIALERHENRRAVVVPIVVRPTDWQGMQFSKLQMLPYEAKAISIWLDFDEAWLDVAKGIRRLLHQMPSEDAEHKVFRSKALNSRMRESFELLESRFEAPRRIGGMSFGLPSLDELTDGVELGDLTLIASRPDHGHVELSLSLIANAASTDGTPPKCLLISQRSSASQLTNRFMCGLGLVSRSRFARGSLDDDDWSRITSSIRLLKEIDLTIDDDRVLSVDELRAALESVRAQGIKLLVIDGIEYANGGGQEREIALYLADFAKREGAAVVVTLTLSPELDSRINRRPLISDLESWHELGNLAGKIIFTYRAACLDWLSSDLALEPSVDAALAKSPDGSQGQVMLNWHAESGWLFDPEASPSMTEAPSDPQSAH